MTSYGCSKSKKNSIKETPMAYPTIALSDCVMMNRLSVLFHCL